MLRTTVAVPADPEAWREEIRTVHPEADIAVGAGFCEVWGLPDDEAVAWVESIAPAPSGQADQIATLQATVDQLVLDALMGS